jgi:drug/metabolite transporter (DMT)-like permease
VLIRRGKNLRKDKLKGLMTLGTLLGVIGLILIFFSDNLGTTLADGLLAALDNIDTMNYEFKVKAKTNNFLVTGSILFGIGLTTMVFAFYKMLNIK